MKTYLICELGLHGEGSLEYHRSIIDQLVRAWSGWPRLIIKTQAWMDPESPWVKAIQATTGRQPLRSLSLYDHGILGWICRMHDFEYGVTFHDEQSLEMPEEDFDWAKLGSFDATNPQLVYEFLQRMRNKRTIASAGLANLDPLAFDRVLQCCSAYPANWTPQKVERDDGYSCHSVPSLIPMHVTDAIVRGCKMVEVHVTNRPRHVRPLPKDMCVSLSVQGFIDLMETVGELWADED